MRFGIRYLLNIKRLLKRVSFIVILLLMPLLIFAMRYVNTKDSGVLNIVLTCEDKSDEYAREITEKLVNGDGMISYRIVDSRESAEKAVAEGHADAAWIFPANFTEKVSAYDAGKGSIVTVIEREDTPVLQLSRTLLYGKLFPHIAYDMYEQYVLKTLGIDIPHEKLLEIYKNNEGQKSIIEVKQFYGDYAEENEELNYLNAPLRGMLSLVVVLCGLAAAMYFLEDMKAQRYGRFSPPKRIVAGIALCLAAVTLAGIAMFISIYVSGTNTSLFKELITMLLFIPCAAGFAVLMCSIFRSPARLGAWLPLFIIFMLVLSPVFLDLPVLKPVQMIFPTTMYLKACVDPWYILYSVIYLICISCAVFVINRIRNIA